MVPILKEADRYKRQEMLMHADADQINAVSEMVMNLLKNRIPVKLRTLSKIKRHEKVLREVGKRRNSLKRRREHLVRQTGNGFWQSLKECYEACR